MKNIYKINSLLLLAWLVSGTGLVRAGDLEDAYAAYQANDFLEAATLIRPLAREGLADAEYLYGRMFENGEGVVKDLMQARTLYEDAARQGHAKAKKRLVEMTKSGATGGGNDGSSNRRAASAAPKSSGASRIEMSASLSADGGDAGRFGAPSETTSPVTPAMAPRASPGSTSRGEESVALDWYLDSAKRGDPDAQYNLGVVYETGMGTAVNEREAARWYREAVAAKHDGAQLRLGLLLVARGEGASVGEGNRLLRAAAGGGNKIAERFVQDILDAQRPAADAEAMMAQRLREALMQSEGQALSLLRDRRALMEGGPTRFSAPVEVAANAAPAAVEGFARPAPPANLGNETRTIRGRHSDAPFLSDMDQVPRLVDGPKGAQVVFPPSMGEVRPSPPAEFAAPRAPGDADTAGTLQSAALQGQGDAQFQLGMAFLAGKGVRRDENEGWQWIRKAAAQQHPGAQTFLRLIETTRNTDSAQSRAVSWLLEGARQGDAEAIYQLANVYEAGRGVPQDAALAGEWYRVAAALGHPGAVRQLGGVRGADGVAAVAPLLDAPPRAKQASSGDWIWILLTAAAAIAVLVMLFRSPVQVMEAGKLGLPDMSGIGRRLFGGLAPTQLQVNEMQLMDLWAQDAAAPATRAERAEVPAPAAKPRSSAPPAAGGVEINSQMVNLAAMPPAPVQPPQPPPDVGGKVVDITAMPTAVSVPQGMEICPETGVLVAKAPIIDAKAPAVEAKVPIIDTQASLVDISALPPQRPVQPSAPIPQGMEICPETGMLVAKAQLLDMNAPAAQFSPPPAPMPEVAPAATKKSERKPAHADSRLASDRLIAIDTDDISTRHVGRAQRTHERVRFEQFSDLPIGMIKDLSPTPASSSTEPLPTPAEESTSALPIVLASAPSSSNLVTLPPETGEEGAVPFNVGMMFYRGQGAPKNDKLAFRWLLKAAELNHAEAQFRVAEMYTQGMGVEKNRLLSLKWMRKSAAAKYQPAVQALEDRKPKLMT